MKRILMLAFAGLLFLGWGAGEASAWHRHRPRRESGVILRFDFGPPAYPYHAYEGPFYRGPYYSGPYYPSPYYYGPFYGGPSYRYYGAPRGPWRDRD